MKDNYMFKSILINFVGINIIINGFFYWVGFKDHQGILTLSTIQSDLLFGLVLLGVLCSYIGLDNTTKDLMSGNVNLKKYKFSAIHKVLPKNNYARIVILLLGVVFFVYPFFSLIPSLFGVFEINHLIGFTFKILSAAIAAGLIGYIVVVLCMEDYRKMRL